MEDQPLPKKNFRELAGEHPENPGLRMLAEAEAHWERNGFGVFDHMLHTNRTPTEKP